MHIHIREFLTFRIAPRVHFSRLVIVFLCVLAVSLVLHVIFFNRILSRNVFSYQKDTTQTLSINEDRLETVLRRFDEKEARRNTILEVE